MVVLIKDLIAAQSVRAAVRRIGNAIERADYVAPVRQQRRIGVLARDIQLEEGHGMPLVEVIAIDTLHTLAPGDEQVQLGLSGAQAFVFDQIDEGIHVNLSFLVSSVYGLGSEEQFSRMVAGCFDIDLQFLPKTILWGRIDGRAAAPAAMDSIFGQFLVDLAANHQVEHCPEVRGRDLIDFMGKFFDRIGIDRRVCNARGIKGRAFGQLRIASQFERLIGSDVAENLLLVESDPDGQSVVVLDFKAHRMSFLLMAAVFGNFPNTALLSVSPAEGRRSGLLPVYHISGLSSANEDSD